MSSQQTVLNTTTSPEAASEMPVTVTVASGGLGDDWWSITINDQTLSGSGFESLAEAEGALWNVPAGGGLAEVEGSGSIAVPHRAAGQTASITLAGLAMVAGGDEVTLAVRAGDDPLD
ncbi:hypothetical protein [Mycolicibacterium fortuitum]|uniref:hypothetical protein n=1 Tax=Mycolicibacterium fortuitum TaxID=1766 RepID=UPI001CE0B496|nr:hypothetical protein [Mycolicibacterium fortuitum]MCA4727146.1 hypothetical protein [Mycolicibacterium fortuitum]